MVYNAHKLSCGFFYGPVGWRAVHRNYLTAVVRAERFKHDRQSVHHGRKGNAPYRARRGHGDGKALSPEEIRERPSGSDGVMIREVVGLNNHLARGIE